MGTNYYLKIDTCPCCGYSKEELHIGKSSAGWCFSLHTIPELGLNTLEDWKKKFEEGDIISEYGMKSSTEYMLVVITDRSWDNNFNTAPRGYDSWDTFHSINQSEVDSNGLIRYKIDGCHCVGHGEGTWDYISGDFS